MADWTTHRVYSPFLGGVQSSCCPQHAARVAKSYRLRPEASRVLAYARHNVMYATAMRFFLQGRHAKRVGNCESSRLEWEKLQH